MIFESWEAYRCWVGHAMQDVAGLIQAANDAAPDWGKKYRLSIAALNARQNLEDDFFRHQYIKHNYMGYTVERVDSCMRSPSTQFEEWWIEETGGIQISEENYNWYFTYVNGRWVANERNPDDPPDLRCEPRIP